MTRRTRLAILAVLCALMIGLVIGLRPQSAVVAPSNAASPAPPVVLEPPVAASSEEPPLAPSPPPVEAVPSAATPAPDASATGTLVGTVWIQEYDWSARRAQEVVAQIGNDVEAGAAVALQWMRGDLDRKVAVDGDVRVLTDEMKLVATTRLDSEGHFRLEGIPFGTYYIQAILDSGHGTIKSITLEPRYGLPDGHFGSTPEAVMEKTVDLAIQGTTFSIAGRVTDVQGRPIAGARIVAGMEYAEATQFNSVPFVSEGPEVRYEGIGHEITGADGRYQITGLPAARAVDILRVLTRPERRLQDTGYYRVSASDEGYHPQHQFVPAVPGGARTFFQALYEGTASNEALSDLLGLHPLDDDALGRFPVDGPVMEVNFQLQRAAVGRGRLLDSMGDPVADAVIRLEAGPAEDTSVYAFAPAQLPPIVTTTDSEGYFDIHSAGPGDYDVFLEVGGTGLRPTPQGVHITPGQGTLDLPLTIPAGNVLGAILLHAVHDPGGEGIARVEAEVVEIVGRDSSTANLGTRVATEAPGTVHIEGIDPGTAIVRVRAPDYPVREVEIAVRGGQTTEVELQFQAGASLSGEITYGGAPVHFAHMEFRDMPGTPTMAVQEEGRYTMGQLTPGEWQVHVRIFTDWGVGTVIQAVRTVQLAQGAETQLDIALPAGGMLHGSFRGPGDLSWHVHVYQKDRADETQMAANRCEINPDGHYEIIGLPPGAYVVYAECKNGEETVSYQGHEVQILEAAPVVLDIQFE